MKRLSAIFLAAVLILLLIPVSAAHAEGPGDLVITSETVSGKVRDVVKVSFYLYPNLPDGKRLDSLSGSLLYDPDVLTFAAISKTDEEHNLDSLMNGRASSSEFNEVTPGEVRFAFIDAYGVEKEGFWFQAEFRIEKEGASAFVFNGLMYSGVDPADYSTESFYIDPVSVGGVYTEGETVPTDAADDVTFAPLVPDVEGTPAATGSGGEPVPVTSSLPEYSGNPGSTEAVTDTPEPTETVTDTPEPTEAPTDTPEPVAEPTAEPVTPAPIETQTAEPVEPEPEKAPSFPLKMVLIAGIVAVLALCALAVVLILIRRKKMEREE